MQKCPTCGHTNRPGVVFCENCGTNLIAGARPQSTKALDGDKQNELESSLGRSVFDTGEQGTATFPEDGVLRMEIDGSPDPIIMRFEHHEMILGRRDPATGALPDVDLTPFAGYRMGVSRRHSLIRLTDKRVLEILDLGSANGTMVNGRRLEPHHPETLHDGDRVKLGEITLLVRFQKTPSEEGEMPAVKPVEPTDAAQSQTALLGGPVEASSVPAQSPVDPPSQPQVAQPPAPEPPKPNAGSTTVQAPPPSPAEAGATTGASANPPSDPALDTQRVDDKPPSDKPEPPKPVEPEPPKSGS